MKKTTVLLLSIIACLPAKADEGMWLLPLLKQQNAQTMQSLGLNISIDDIYNPDSTSLKDAVVIFGGGCTGELISPEGLLLTNHHCGYGSIQKLSSVENNYLKDGFWASQKQAELAVEGLTVRFVEKIEDVTDYVKAELAAETDPSPYQFLSPSYLNKLARKKIGENYLSENPWFHVEIKPLYNGNQYYMYVYKTYSDVRLVGTPPSSIGKFGADTDNWMWPRHTGDFSLFRIYTDLNGNPAKYSPSNIPFRPKKYFNISLKGIQDNDFTMIMGFPGSTNRFYTSEEIRLRKDVQNAIRIEMDGIKLEQILEEMLADEKTKIQYASKYAGVSNYWKNSIGMNRGIDNLKLIDEKLQNEAKFKAWAQKAGKPHYAEALDLINNCIKELRPMVAQYDYLGRGIGSAFEYYIPLDLFDNLKEAIKKKDQKKISEITARLKEIYKSQVNKDYNRKVDSKVAKALLTAYSKKMGASIQPDIYALIQKKYKGDCNRFVDELFRTSIFGSDANFESFIKKPTIKAIENDLWLQFEQSVDKKSEELYNLIAPLQDKLKLAKKTYTEGWLEKNRDVAHAPDANFTMRLTYGQVLPYKPKDGVEYLSTTTLTGVMEKEDSSNWEFVVPEKLSQLYRDGDFGEYANTDGTMPCCFIANNDITGGNSGSPVINANGELIGCAFDGNWEAMSGDIVFEPDLQRCINVDIRYILFIIEKYANAKHLIDEMTIIR